MSKITEAARGQECTVRIPSVCNWDSTTVVHAHLNGGGGAMKHHDIHGAFACSACHAWLDGGYVKTASRDERDLAHLQAMQRTQLILLDLGLIQVP